MGLPSQAPSAKTMTSGGLVKKNWMKSQMAWFPPPSLPVVSCVALGKSLNLLEPQFLQLCIGILFHSGADQMVTSMWFEG
jgi:hypothetical protein